MGVIQSAVAIPGQQVEVLGGQQRALQEAEHRLPDGALTRVQVSQVRLQVGHQLKQFAVVRQ